MSDRLIHFADLLMGAAYSDKHLSGEELEKTKALLTQLASEDTLPDTVVEHLDNFDPIKLDVDGAVMGLDLKTEDEKVKLLELIAAVHEADDVWDMDEDLYLGAVALALGLPKEAYSQLTAEISIGDVGKVLMPPPLPAGAPNSGVDIDIEFD